MIIQIDQIESYLLHEIRNFVVMPLVQCEAAAVVESLAEITGTV